MKAQFKTFSLFLFLVLGVASTAIAQEQVGNIEGTVKDEQGAVVPNVSVTVGNKATGKVGNKATGNSRVVTRQRRTRVKVVRPEVFYKPKLHIQIFELRAAKLPIRFNESVNSSFPN